MGTPATTPDAALTPDTSVVPVASVVLVTSVTPVAPVVLNGWRQVAGRGTPHASNKLFNTSTLAWKSGPSSGESPQVPKWNAYTPVLTQQPTSSTSCSSSSAHSAGHSGW